MVLGEVTNLKGGLINGIESEDKASYVRSFDILGEENQLTAFFGPELDDELLPNWRVEDSKKIDSAIKESMWTFTEDPNDVNGKAMHQANDVSASEDYTYGTHMINMQFDG